MTRPRLRSTWLAVAGLLSGAAVVALLPQHALFSPPPLAEETEQSATGERWACPMMDFIGNRPGDCPVCGMQMTRVTAGELTREQQRRMGLELTRITEGPAQALVRAYGTVQYDERTLEVIIPRVGGRIVRRHDAARHPGNLVQAGDPVVDLYSPEVYAAQGELAAAVQLGDEPTLRALTQRFERWNLAPLAEAILQGETPRDTITITSPFSGRVILDLPGRGEAMSVRLPQVGQEVMAETPLLQLVDPQAYFVVLQVPENRAHWLRVGQTAQLASDDFGPLPEIQAEIAWLAPELNQEIRSREVHLHLRDPNKRLLPGSLVHARFQAALGPDLRAADPSDSASWGRFALVPKTAVLSTGVRNVAWRVAERQTDGRLRFELAPVALGPRLEDEFGNDIYVVRAGLQTGDEVATQGAFLIDSQAQLAGTPSLLFPNGAAAPAGATHQH
jgi:membrane fusion protein, copper/silver efflux system